MTLLIGLGVLLLLSLVPLWALVSVDESDVPDRLTVVAIYACAVVLFVAYGLGRLVQPWIAQVLR